MSGLLELLGLSWPFGTEDEKPQQKEAVAPRAAQLSNDLMLHHEAATSLDALGDTRDTLLQTGTEQIEAKDYDGAKKTVDSLREGVGKAGEEKTKKAKEDYEQQRKALEADEKAVAELPDTPEDLKQLKATVAATAKKTDEAAGKKKFDEALKCVAQLKKDIKAALDRRDALAKAKQDYESGRKGLEDDETTAKLIGDTPENLKKLKAAYVASRDKTDEHVRNGDFEKALESLKQLKTDLKAAVNARRTGVENETKGKVDSINSQLDKEITFKQKKQKVWQAVGSDEWKGAVDDILALKPDEEFTRDYDKKNAEVADKLANDPVVQNAFDKWDDWNKDPPNVAEIEKLMKQVVKVQSEALGIDPPTPTETFEDKDRPSLCGQYSRKDNKISLNTANKGFKDFRELLDTLTHENTHAYQAKLIKGLEDKTLKPGDPEYSAGMIFAVNTNKGYVTSDESKSHPKDAYNDQPKEVHAWRAGRLAGQEAFAKIKAAKTK